MECPKCKSSHVVKNGSVKGIRKHLCRNCGFQFTRSTPRGKPLKTKILAVVLYMSGLSFNRIGEICSVSAQSVLNWINKFAAERAERPKPAGQTVILELDELWHFLQKKTQTLGMDSCGSHFRSIAGLGTRQKRLKNPLSTFEQVEKVQHQNLLY